jgi:hypothetical protein
MLHASSPVSARNLKEAFLFCRMPGRPPAPRHLLPITLAVARLEMTFDKGYFRTLWGVLYSAHDD